MSRSSPLELKRNKSIVGAENNMVPALGKHEEMETSQEPHVPGASHPRQNQGEPCQAKCCDLWDRDTSLKIPISFFFLPTPGDL